MKRLLFAPLLVLLLFSCRRNEPVVYPDGELRLQRIKDQSGRVATVFEYAPDAKLLSMKNYSPTRKTPDETAYFYDGQGRLERVETSTLGLLSCGACEGPAMNFTQTFEYDGNGRLVRSKNVNQNGWVASWLAYEYDGNGRLTRRDSFTPTGAKGGYTTYAHDARGNVTKTESFDADGALTSRNTYEYDNRPNPFRAVYLGVQAAFFRSPNNIVREKYENFVPYVTVLPPPDFDRATRYDYDPASGYPVRAEYGDGSVSLFDYQ